MLKNSLFSPLCSAPFFCFSLFLFFFSAPHTSFSFLFPVSYATVMLQPSFSFLFVCCPLFFSPKYFFFQPKRFSAQKYFFQPKTFLLQPKTFFFSFFFQFSHSSLLLFSALFFFGLALFFSSFSASFFSFLQLYLSKTQYSLQLLHISYI